MEGRKFEELEDRATDHSLKDLTAQLESRARVIKEIEAMKTEGKALELTEEEENMLRSFRRFKLRMRHHGETFTWQTKLPEGVTIAEETGAIVHPSEGSK